LSALGTALTGGAGFFTADPKTGLTPYDSLTKGLSNAGATLQKALGSFSTTTPGDISTQADALSAAENQGYTLDENTGYLTKDGLNYAFDSNNNPVVVGKID
jgi:hypothetical protein